MLEALMIVAGFVMAPDAYPSHTQTSAIYSTTPYDDYETCLGHLRDRGNEIAKLLLPTDVVTITMSEDETVLVVEGARRTGIAASRVTLMCKEN